MNTKADITNTSIINILDIDVFMRRCAIAFLIAFSFVGAYGQSTTIILNETSNGKNTYVQPSTTYYFYDSGGESGKYGNRENFTYTFESCNPVKITFVSFSTENYSDKLKLYDNGTNETICQGEVQPSTYTATSGKLQISWQSDNTSTYPGWKAKITCIGSNTCSSHTLTYNTIANCTGTANNAPSSVTASGTVVTSSIPTCSTAPYFVGWNTQQDGRGIRYYSGENISLLNNDITLYAQYSECEENIITATGDPSTSYNVPFCSNGDFYSPRSSYSQMLYTRELLSTATGYEGGALIQKISFYYEGYENQNMEFDLYMANSTCVNLNTWHNSGLTLVASKNITFTPGWVDIELDNDFLWDGTHNLIIAMHNKTQIGSYQHRTFYCHDDRNGTNTVRYQYNRYNLISLNSDNYPDGIGTGTKSTITLPDIKFCMIPYCEPPTFLFSTSSATCALGGSYDLTALFSLSNPTGRSVTYTCNPAEATISGTTITPLVGGEITITAHIDAHNGNCEADALAQLTVTCTEPSFEFSQHGVFCTIGNSVSAPAYTTNSTSSDITYSSGNEAIATVNPSSGAVTGVSEGYTTITAYLAASGNFCQKTATFVAYVSPDENCMPFTAGNCNFYSAYAPFYSMSYYSFSYVQMLYTASELRAAGLSAGKINKIAFHYYGRPSSPHNFSQNFRVFIAPTTSTSLSSSWATPTTSFVEKFSGEKSFTQDSWTYIELTDGFNWDGTSNIVIAVNTYESYPEVEVDPNRRFCNSNSEQYVRYVAKQPSELGGATEIPLNANKIPSEPGSSSLYHADIKFCQDASTIILPIELSKFEANCNNNRVNITWTTESEKNNEAFIIERSHNAIDFTEIARIGGSVNSIETINYQYTDENPNTGDNYYRLVQIDTDGTRTQSEIIVAKCHGNNLDNMQVEAYPNPFNDELTISLYNFNGQNTSIEIFDMLGKTIATQTIANPGNYYETTLNLDGFPKAAYSVRISANGATINKLVIKN